MRTIVRILILLSTLNIVKADNVTNLRESPNLKNFQTEDPYKSTSYEDRPFQEEKDLEYFSVDDLLKANLPTFWNYMTSVSKGLEVGELAELKNELNINEKKLLDKLQERIPELTELVEQNENLEAEIQHFLVLRRAELKDLYKQIKRVKKELDLLKVNKVRDLDTVQGRIQSLYDDIDIHLEDPNSSYNDDYIMNRKRRISRLMKKRKVLRTDLKHLNYTKVQRKQKQLEFLIDRKNEIHEHSKTLQFKFTQKRVEAIQKNNARINYLISVTLPKKHIKKIRRSMKMIRKIRDKIAKMEKTGATNANNMSGEEQSIRFEKEYYTQIERREQELMDEIRSDREKIKGFRSKSKVNNQVSQGTNSTKNSDMRKNQVGAQRSSAPENNEYVYVYKTKESPSSSKMVTSKDGGAMWVFPVKQGTNVLQSIEGLGNTEKSLMMPNQGNNIQNSNINQQLENLMRQNRLLQQQLNQQNEQRNTYNSSQNNYQSNNTQRSQNNYQQSQNQNYQQNNYEQSYQSNVQSQQQTVSKDSYEQSQNNAAMQRQRERFQNQQNQTGEKPRVSQDRVKPKARQLPETGLDSKNSQSKDVSMRNNSKQSNDTVTEEPKLNDALDSFALADEMLLK
ncbi:MAG: hypothetical protein KC646_09190 [Candidatus Cloacimonetes bacterium]|nr:hypothetical protein [Candidatus Cloacimonadota bacterium]